MLKIRSLRKEDIAQITPWRERVHEMHSKARPDLFAEDFGPELQRIPWEILESRDQAMFIAVMQEDGTETIVGYIGVSYLTEEDTVYFKECSYCYVDELFVKEEYRKQRIAQKLFLYAQKAAEEMGCQGLYIDVWDFNREGICAFEKMGFKPLRHYMEFTGNQAGEGEAVDEGTGC